MAEKDQRTNTMRLLESKRIPYVVHRFSPDIHSADEVADVLGLPAGQVFKTLVVLPEGAGRPRPLLAVIPADRELDLKRLAKAAGEKSVHMALHREAEALTGLLVGGISALALLQKRWKVLLDSSALAQGEIVVSAGQRGINLQLSANDFIAVTGAQTAEIARGTSAIP